LDSGFVQMIERKLNLQYPVYPDLTRLPNDKRIYACWYYYTLAMKLKEKLGDGSTDAQFGLLEGERWMDPQYEQIARSVALMYGLSNPGEFMTSGIWRAVEAQAVEIGLPVPAEVIKRPLRLVIN
jgi:hypothetical protein